MLLRRALSVASSPAARTRPSSASVLLSGPARFLSSAAPRQNLYELCATLPNYGIGSRVYRESWAAKGYSPGSHHYVVTKAHLRKGCEPDAWGVRCWKGTYDDKVESVRQAGKREWVLLSSAPKEEASSVWHAEYTRTEELFGRKVDDS